MKLKGSLQPIILQSFGLLLLVAFVLIWALTGEQSPLLVGAALTLVAVGSGTSAIITVRQEIELPIDQSHEAHDSNQKTHVHISDEKTGNHGEWTDVSGS